MALATNLVSYYKLDSTADSVGSNTLTNNGTVTFGTGKLGNAAVFTSSSQSLSLASSVFDFERTDSFSFSTWIYLNGLTTTQMIISKQGNSSPYKGYNFAVTSSGQIDVELINDGGSNFIAGVTATGLITTGKWFHVAMVYSGTSLLSGIIIYINGIAYSVSGSGTLSSSIKNSSPFNIGNRSTFTNFDGLIDEVGIWSRALTADEISQIYNSNRGNAYPLTDSPSLYGGVVYYKLDESSGNAVDSIGSNTATNTSVTYSAGKINNGAVFNGSAQLNSVSTVPNGSAYSISLWFKTTKNDGSYSTMYCSSSSSGGGTTADVFLVSETHRVLYQVGGTLLETTATIYNDGNWHHALFTMDSTAGILYVDGTAVASGTITAPSTNRYPTIGYYVGSASNSMVGSVDEVVYFNRTLSSTEVTSLYNGGSGNQYPWTGTPINSGFFLFM